MMFNFQWTTKETGNYAIRKRDAKGKKAGQEIEAKAGQASKDYFFLLVDKDDADTMYNLYKTNAILKTITYEYVYKGTGKKSLSKYLTKTDIENILQNIESYKNKTITIETTPPKQTRTEKTKADNDFLKKEKDYYEKKFGKQNTKRLLKLLVERHTKQRELKEQIKIIKKETERIEENIFTILKTTTKGSEKISYRDISKLPDFQNTLNDFYEVLYRVAKLEQQREEGRNRQSKYRGRKRRKKVEKV